jgi:hypothetical protein
MTVPQKPAKRARKAKAGAPAAAAVAAVLGADGFYPDGTCRPIYGLRNRNRAVCHLNAVIVVMCSIQLIARVVVDQGAAAFGVGGAIRGLLVAWRHRETSVSPDGVIAALQGSSEEHRDVVDIISSTDFFDAHQDPAGTSRALLLALAHERPASAIPRAVEIGVQWHRVGADDCGWSTDDHGGEVRLEVHCRANDLALAFADVEEAIIPACSHPIVICPTCAQEAALVQEACVAYWPALLAFVIDLHDAEDGAGIELPKMLAVHSRQGDEFLYELAAWIPRVPGLGEDDELSSELGHCTAFVRTSDGLVHFDDDVPARWLEEPDGDTLPAEFARVAYYRQMG